MRFKILSILLLACSSCAAMDPVHNLDDKIELVRSLKWLRNTPIDTKTYQSAQRTIQKLEKEIEEQKRRALQGCME